MSKKTFDAKALIAKYTQGNSQNTPSLYTGKGMDRLLKDLRWPTLLKSESKPLEFTQCKILELRAQATRSKNRGAL